MNQQHHSRDTKLYGKGAMRDTDKELISLGEGMYVDACNMRTMPMDGDNSSIKKINGEVVLYQNLDNRCSLPLPYSPLATTYECIGTAEINNNIVEFWADAAEVEPSLIRVNGLVVCMSSSFPIKAKYPLQIAKNESCIGGEVYITDYNVAPMLFNIKDLLLNSNVNIGTETGSCTEKYFSLYDQTQHTLNIARAIDAPVFIKLDAVGGANYSNTFGTAGLPVGYYTYSFRYVTAAGDRTAWSPPTPLIPVVNKVAVNLTSSASTTTAYHSFQTHSKDADISIPSQYGAHIKFRVDNDSDFDFIEIRRDSWNTEAGIGTAATSEIIGKIDIVADEFRVVNVLDKGGFEEILSGADTTTVMAAIERAKAIRYFNQRLYLMNVEYAKRDITNSVSILEYADSSVLHPAISNIEEHGHKDPWTATYRKSEMRGEINGYGILVWDDQGQWSFVKKIDLASNYQFPNRRAVTSTYTENISYKGTPVAANVNGAVSNTHEVFDLREGSKKKTNKCLFVNILDAGSVAKSRINGDPDCEDAPSGSASDIGYHPFSPTKQTSTIIDHTNYVVNTYAGKNEGGASLQDYEPEGFNPRYFSLGAAFRGVNNLPSWAKAFSIVKSNNGGRVVAQGLAYYNLSSADGTVKNTTKSQDQFIFYSPDLDENIGVATSLVDSIKADPTAFEIQFVSPLGFFTEIYSFDQQGAGRDKGVDLITYCRILQDRGEINFDESPFMGIGDGTPSNKRYVGFGKWRAQTQFSSLFPSGGGGNGTFDIGSISDVVTSSARQKMFKITMLQNLFAKGNTNGQHGFDDSDVQDWHEPVYAVNIIKKGAGIPDENTTNYKYCGHYQKIKSKIWVSDGVGGGANPIYLVDERWEDCINEAPNQFQNAYATYWKFLTIEDAAGNSELWTDIQGKTAIEISAISSSLTANGYADVTDPSGTYRINGVYNGVPLVSDGFIGSGTAETPYVYFAVTVLGLDAKYQIPTGGKVVYVRYDNRFPVRVFGGNTWINESVFAVKDKIYNKNGNPSDDSKDFGTNVGDDFRINVGFPYPAYYLNPRYLQVESTTGINKIQDKRLMLFENAAHTAGASVAQLIAMWTAETRINLSFAFNDETTLHNSTQYFPLKNYVVHPHEWDDTSFGGTAADVYNDNNIFSDYETDYGDEFNNWQYGGFRFSPQVNDDYTQEDYTRVFTSVPEVGFKEQDLFCTRIVYSNKRPVNIQDTPTVRTFPTENIYDLTDDTGEIKFAWSSVSKKGNNLYAITDQGVAMLLVDKRVISEIQGTELATVGSDIGGILNEYWLNTEIGMADEMWRSAAEYSNMLYWSNYKSAYKMYENEIIDIGRMGYHSKLYGEFLNNFSSGYSDKITGVYDVLHNEYWVDFLKVLPNPDSCTFGRYINIVDSVYGAGCSGASYGATSGETIMLSEIIEPSTSLDGVFLGGLSYNMLSYSVCIKCDPTSPYPLNIMFSGTMIKQILQGECFCFTPANINDEGVPEFYTISDCEKAYPECSTLVFGEGQKRWQGAFSYKFDRYLSFDNKTYGMKDMETYLLDEGKIINGQILTSEVVSGSNKDIWKDKEFIRIRINSDNKPVKAEFYTDLSQVLNNNPQASLDTAVTPLAFKNYYGFEQYIPRKIAAPKNRMQGRLLLFKIIHNLDEDFRISSTDIQYKQLK